MPSKSRSRKLSIKYRFKKTLKINTKKPLMIKSKINYSSNRWKNMKGGVIHPQQYRDKRRNYDDDNSSSESEQSSSEQSSSEQSSSEQSLSEQSSLKQSLLKQSKRIKLDNRKMFQGQPKQYPPTSRFMGRLSDIKPAAAPVGEARTPNNKGMRHQPIPKKRKNYYNSSSESGQSLSKRRRKRSQGRQPNFPKTKKKSAERPPAKAETATANLKKSLVKAAAKATAAKADISDKDKRLYLLYIIEEENGGYTSDNEKPLLEKLELLKKQGLIEVDKIDQDEYEYDNARYRDFNRQTKRNQEIIMDIKKITPEVIDEVYRANLGKPIDINMLKEFSKMQI